jgi:hypothetical protein
MKAWGPGCITHCTGAEWAPGTVWTGAENLVPTPGFNPRPIQTIASHCNHVTKGYRWCRGQTLISALHDRQWLTSRPGHFKRGKEPHYPLTEGWMGPRAGVVDLEKRKILCLIGLEVICWLVISSVGGCGR